MCYNVIVKPSKINIVVEGKRIICLHQRLKIQETSELAGCFISFKDTDLQEFDSHCR
jgi:hypothetical protein